MISIEGERSSCRAIAPVPILGLPNAESNIETNDKETTKGDNKHERSEVRSN
jgi:hypothetical protein